MAWVSLFGLAAVSPTAVVFKPATLADPLVLALVAYVAVVPGALSCAAWNVAVQPPEVSRGVAPNAVLTYSARPLRRRNWWAWPWPWLGSIYRQEANPPDQGPH